eukprot:6208887-Pleurochrysis_carterae.AAC.7
MPSAGERWGERASEPADSLESAHACAHTADRARRVKGVAERDGEWRRASIRVRDWAPDPDEPRTFVTVASISANLRRRARARLAILIC